MAAVSLLRKKIKPGQVVPNFTGQVVSSKILQIFRWKLWVTLCSVCSVVFKYVVKIARHKNSGGNELTLSSSTFMFRLKEKFSVFRNFFDQWNFSIEDCTFLHCRALE